MKKIGMTHIYTGDGKGKTTAAIGLALRAAGAGMKIFIAQFIKAGKTSEYLTISKYLPMITFKAFGNGRYIKQKAFEKEKNDTRNAINYCSKIVESGYFDIVILDEIFPAINAGLLSKKEIKNIILRKSQSVELVLTGRGAPKSIIKLADLVTEMKEIKHYYKKGIKARKGIEI